MQFQKNLINRPNRGKFFKLQEMPEKSFKLSFERQNLLWGKIPRQSGHGTSNFKIIFQTQMWYQMKAKSLNFYEFEQIVKL